jgi:hypothetical protein
MLRQWTPKVWNQPSVPPTNIITQVDIPYLWGNARSWWYDGYQDNLPLVHLTNLLYSAQVERNWTNYYHKVRDAIPTPASPRVWQDSYNDIFDLLLYATMDQMDYMMNDSLFPPEYHELRLDIYTRVRRKSEDE